MEHSNVSYETGVDIVALATPWAPSALCVIRCSGDTVRERLAPVFSACQKLLASAGGEFFYGKLIDPNRSQVLDEVVLLYSQSPRSYTGEHVIEIMGHGSLVGMQAILQLCVSQGMRPALPGEFSFRAFVHGKTDLTQAEAVHEIVSAQSSQSHAMALKRLGGAVQQEINRLKDMLLDFMAQVNLQLDYAEGEAEEELALPVASLAEVQRALGVLQASYDYGQRHKEGFRVALVGKTNAGKSSLFNLLLRQDRSIVSEVHGTTRDYVEAEVILEGRVLHLFDTAGLRETQEPVEQEGIRRSWDVMAGAQLIVYVLEGLAPWDLAGQSFLQARRDAGQKVLLVVNKVDALSALEHQAWHRALQGYLVPYVLLSTVSLEGLPEFKAHLSDFLTQAHEPATQSLYLESRRQYDLLVEASRALKEVQVSLENQVSLDLLAVDGHRALVALGQITGQVTQEDMLERLFSSFCLGK